jgi:hypothetical protein
MISNRFLMSALFFTTLLFATYPGIQPEKPGTLEKLSLKKRAWNFFL